MKLLGHIDGKEVVFDFFPPDRFKATFPRNLTGLYIVELKIISDSGQESFLTTTAVLIDFEAMQIKPLSLIKSIPEGLSTRDKEIFKKYEGQDFLSIINKEIKVTSSSLESSLENKFTPNKKENIQEPLELPRYKSSISERFIHQEILGGSTQNYLTPNYEIREVLE